MNKQESCALCGGPLTFKYIPMETWGIKGKLCGNCYSKKIAEYYPGEHVRTNLLDK